MDQAMPTGITETGQLFGRFTDRFRRAVEIAKQQAIRLNHDQLEPEHLLLGLVMGGLGVGAVALRDFGALITVKIELEKRLTPDPAAHPSQPLPSPAYTRVIERAILESVRFGHIHIGTEHLLVGLLTEKESLAGKLLSDFGISVERTRDEISRLLQPPHDRVARCQFKLKRFSFSSAPPRIPGTDPAWREDRSRIWGTCLLQ
jgi:ATP-dependent Clp protease ATP-binding subunit ClpC